MLFSSFAKLCAKGAGIKNNPGDRVVVGAQRGKRIFLSSGNGKDKRRVGAGEKTSHFLGLPFVSTAKYEKLKVAIF